MSTRLRLFAAATLASAIAVVFAGCEQAARRRDCTYPIWIPGKLSQPRVIGSWNGWVLPLAPERFDDANWLLRLELPAGEHRYLIVGDDGVPFIDPLNPLTAFREPTGEEVSLLVIPDCSSPLLTADETTTDADGTVVVSGRFLAGASAAKLDPETLTAATENGTLLEVMSADSEAGTWSARATGLGRGKHTVLVNAADVDGTAAERARAATWVAPGAATFDDAVLYQVMIDRFRGDGGAALATPETPGDRAGGTLDGVRSALEEGYFDRLGVTMLWLSPVYENPEGTRLGDDGREYSSYHGYWPLGSRSVDVRLGGEEALDALIDTAHQRGIAVLLDLVPNHVYEDNPLFVEHQDDGWFHAAGCVCGSETCPWSEHIRECWFTPYLPDVRWQHAPTLGHAAAEARFWLERFDVDGFRIDAVPMMERAATRRIADELRRTTSPVNATFLIGEVFTGPGVGGLGEIDRYLGPATLDSAFDFPLMWALRDAIASASGGFDGVDAMLDAGDAAFEGSGATLAHMLDNHDVSRFVSVANGDDGRDPWDAPPPQPTDEAVYRRQMLGLAALFTLPGIPTLYYGDEVGLAGAGDPDSRRVMPGDPALLPIQLEVRAASERLGQLRLCSAALRGRARETLHVDGLVYGFVRGDDPEQSALIVLNAGAGPAQGLVPPGVLPPGEWLDAFDGTPADDPSTNGLTLEPLSFRILLRPGDPCRSD